jgi:hypothetical protein
MPLPTTTLFADGDRFAESPLASTRPHLNSVRAAPDQI